MADCNLSYKMGSNGDYVWNRILDLLYFTHYLTLLDTKFIINEKLEHPIFVSDYYSIEIFDLNNFKTLPWVYFIDLFKSSY